MSNTTATALVIAHVTTVAAARALVAQGYCPVECSLEGESVVDDLVMDHHGALSALEGVAVRAYRDHFGARASDPRFVVTGAADADATFAIAALAGLLPHPSRAGEFESAPPFIRAPMTRDLSAFAALVNRVDCDPIGVRLEEQEGGDALLLFNQVASHVQDATAFYAGVDTWRMLLGSRPPKGLLAAAKTEEASRVAEAREKCEVIAKKGAVALVESPVWGFDVWYAEHAPCVLAINPHTGGVTVGCRDAATAERLFGAGGLKNVFADLTPAGWGGRETIGGSPRGVKMTREQATAAFAAIVAMVK